MDVIYRLGDEPDVGDGGLRDPLTPLRPGERPPGGEPQDIPGMLKLADILVTARVEGRLVGISRAITDFSYCTYLSDLAVDEAYQGRGVGRELIRRTHEAAGLQTMLSLLAAPKARGYYPHAGMAQHESCWIVPRSV